MNQTVPPLSRRQSLSLSSSFWRVNRFEAELSIAMEQQSLILCRQSIATELQLRTKFEHVTELDSTKPLSLHTLSLARSLIFNPSTSEPTISSIFETLAHSLNPTPNPLSLLHTLSLLSDLAVHRPHLSHVIFTAVLSFSQLCNHNSTRTLTEALSLLISIAESDETLIPSINELSEGLFVSLVFRPCVATRHWLLLNAERFFVRPSLLLTVLLGFTNDPYPYVRGVSLDGLVSLGKSIVVVEDHDLVGGCYCRAVELLNDMEGCVRSAAVRAVSEWGRLHVALNQDKSKVDWSDALFVQLCSMVRDMSLEVRVEAFDALGKIGMVSEDILLQTVSKKVIAIMKDKKYPGQCLTKQRELPASSAAGAFIHGLEDEFYEIRRSACHSLRTLTIHSSKFAGEALNFLMDVLIDDSLAVRLQALETMHHMAVFDCLKVQDTHMHMFLGTLVDTSGSIRSAARRTLRSMKLSNMAMFKLSVEGLLKNLEMHPQDEADVFSVLFNIGRRHGNFVVSIINEVSDEIEPSCEGKLVFDSARVAALLVLAVSVPLSCEQRICSIPPTIFSYAVTMLGRISHALNDIMDQNTLLAYLSHCSRSTTISAADFTFKEKEPFLPVTEGRIPTNTGSVRTSPGMHLEDYQFENHEVTESVKLILAKIKDIWQLIQHGCTSDVQKTLRSWKEELVTYTLDSPANALSFILKYLRVVKLLSKTWMYFKSPRKPHPYGMVEVGVVLAKLDSTLGEMRYRFIGLSKEEELHILELILLSCTLRLSSSEGCFESALVKKLYSVISRVEFLHKEASVEPSNFVIELKKLLCDFDPSDGAFYSPFSFQKLVEFFSLEQFVFSGKLEHIKAEVDVHDNDFQNPFPYISGLPVGIPLEICLYNISRENKLWLRITLYEDLTEFIFLDLDQFEGSDKIRKFTFVAPFYKTPKASVITLRVCIGMECSSEDVNLYKGYGGPKRELTYLCKEKQVYLSMVVKE